MVHQITGKYTFNYFNICLEKYHSVLGIAYEAALIFFLVYNVTKIISKNYAVAVYCLEEMTVVVVVVCRVLCVNWCL